MDAEREQAVRDRASAFWEREGRPAGRDLEHWLRAEAEIAAEAYVGVTDDGKFMEGALQPASPARRRRTSRR